jgi:hypothetical protein
MNVDALFVIACPTCRGNLATLVGHGGRTGCCPLCAAIFLVPAAPSVTEPPVSDHPPAVAAPATARPQPEPDPFAGLEAAGEGSREPATVSPGLVFRDPVRTIGDGSSTVELRRLTDEERRVRRARRNIFLLVAGGAVLIMLTVAFGYRPAR